MFMLSQEVSQQWDTSVHREFGIWLWIQLEGVTLNEMRAGISNSRRMWVNRWNNEFLPHCCEITAQCFFAVSEPTAAVSLHKWENGGEKLIDGHLKENSGIVLWLWSQCSAIWNNRPLNLKLHSGNDCYITNGLKLYLNPHVESNNISIQMWAVITQRRFMWCLF